MKKPYVLFLLFTLLSLHLVAQRGITVAASVDKTSILIGQPLQLTLEATFSKPHAPSFFQFDSLPHFEVLNRTKIDTQALNDRTILKQTVTLISWDSGVWALPALSLTAVKTAVTKPLPVAVTFSPMQPNQDYHDVKDILDVPKPQRTTWYWYVIGAALLLLLVLLVFPRKKKAAVVDSASIKEGAFRQALKELDALRSKTVPDDKTYFTELILIFRAYLHQRKGIHSFQQTTDDLSRQLQALQLPHEDFKKLVQTLQLSDFVKFAQLTVTTNERDEAWHEIKKNITAIENMKP